MYPSFFSVSLSSMRTEAQWYKSAINRRWRWSSYSIVWIRKLYGDLHSWNLLKLSTRHSRVTMADSYITKRKLLYSLRSKHKALYNISCAYYDSIDWKIMSCGIKSALCNYNAGSLKINKNFNISLCFPFHHNIHI